MNSKERGAVKVTFLCDPDDKIRLKGSKGVMHISVGQEYQEGEKFEATIDLVNETFRECDIMICDSLQRHSLALTSETEELTLYKKSIEEGDRWLERNENTLNCLKIPHRIVRWDYWLKCPEYNKNRAIIETLYSSNESYYMAVNNTVNKFLKRLQNRINTQSFDYERAFSFCLEYLKEECAIIIPIWSEFGYDFVIYPRKRTEAMEATYQLLIKPFHEDLMRPVAFKFTRRSIKSPFNC